ncbi:MAG: hypothetical protein IIZ55_01185 [Firmicutes bacterium]|nr:hypothetical protein [Bacillota bacterium]
MALQERNELGYCPLCGRALLGEEGAARLRDGKQICGLCAVKLRPAFPAAFSSDFGKLIDSPDPLSAIGLEQAEQAAGNAASVSEELRRKYGGFSAVFVIEKAEKEKGGLLKAVWRVTGRAVLGAFFPRDKVLLVSGGAKTTLELDDVETVAPAAASRGSLFWKRAYGGTIASFTVTARGSIGPGDMIVKE